MINKEEHDRTINGLLEAAEVAKRKLLEYLQEKNVDEIIIEINDMDEDNLNNLNDWALKGEFYRVCQAIKEFKESK
ncbi:hypothetical protein [Aquimarina aquimarini]|uniref:hypothetical protein n=1 Tax=Aquimarina aquimarini TaxID=1191734 RepID=UPI000D54DE7D|nr:hypothetical protein [Aquimarina aquimarini]